MVYFTADQHFGNDTVIRIDNRNYPSVEAMDIDLINRWNAKVNTDDTVFIMGDFIHRPQKGWKYYLERLNGSKILILGNHDYTLFDEMPSVSERALYFKAITQSAEIQLMDNDTKALYDVCGEMILNIKSAKGQRIVSTDDSRKIVLSHYPILEWNGYYRGFWHIHGHIHNHRQDTYKKLIYEDRALNAGCQITDYSPVSFSELVHFNELFKGKQNDEFCC